MGQENSPKSDIQRLLRQCVLGLFAKEPRIGQVKTRLAAATSAEWAARAAEAFLCDLVERLAPLEADRWLVYSPPEARDYFARFHSRGFQTISQGEGDLGRRLERFMKERLEAGAHKVVVLGADSPTLPLGFIEQAFTLLDEANVVLGPALDGGYYLIGCSRRTDWQSVLPPLFDGIPWGGERVLVESIARLADPSWKLALLPPWYDVDTLEGCWQLKGHVAAMRRAGLDPGIPHTQKLLEDTIPCACPRC